MAALWVSEDRVVPICRMGMPQWMSTSASAPGLELGIARRVTLRETLGTTHCSDGLLGVSPGLCARGGRCCTVPILNFGVAPSGCHCYFEWVTTALVIFPSQTHWLGLLC